MASLYSDTYVKQAVGIFHWYEEDEHFDFHLCEDCAKEFYDWIHNKDKHLVS